MNKLWSKFDFILWTIILGLSSIGSFVLGIYLIDKTLKTYLFIFCAIFFILALFSLIRFFPRIKYKIVMPSSETNIFYNSRVQKNLVNKKKHAILSYLYDAHRALFNTEDTPVSTRILETDLHLEKRELLDLLKEMANDEEIKIIKLGSNLFMRIETKGIKIIENR